MKLVLDVTVGLVPVFLFLFALIFLDSFKLIKTRLLFVTIAYGMIAGVVAYWPSSWLIDHFFEVRTFTRYVGPVLEELLKAACLVYLIQTKRMGFMVDAAIYGFSIGAGFAFTENIFYADAIRDANILLWIIRGFGTAIMHGGTTAIAGILMKNLSDRYPKNLLRGLLPGAAAAIFIHSFFNHFFLPPVASTALILLTLPALLAYVFKQSEKTTREWLGVNLDADMELLDLIESGNISESKIGQYLLTLKSRFAPEVIFDMLCLLRIHTELSVKSKGILMMREAGFKIPSDPEITAKFDEMKYLEKSIGRIGKMAILPFLHTSAQSLWQIYMIKE